MSFEVMSKAQSNVKHRFNKETNMELRSYEISKDIS